MTNGKCLKSFDYPRSKTKVFSTCMDISEKVSMLALGTASGRITILSTISFDIIHEILHNDENGTGTLGPVRVCRFSPDGKMLAKGHDTGVIEILDVGEDWRKLYPPLKLHET